MNQIKNNKYDPLEINVINGINIYTGNSENSIIKTKFNIEKYKNKLDKKIFTKLEPSTMAIKGASLGIEFDEKELIHLLGDPVGTDIIMIKCNYGEITNSKPNYIAPPPKEKTTKRGRKQKPKIKSKRKIQGSGKYFSSQITFEIYNSDTNKVYKIKLFRNGSFQSPGIKDPLMTDLIKPIITLRDYLRKELKKNIEIIHSISIMRNYICNLINPKYLIRLNELENIFTNYKNNNEHNKVYSLIDSYDILYKNMIKSYVGKKYNQIGIAEIQNNRERYFGLIIKFYRPVNGKIDKRTTIKILRSGKINIDGGNSIEECYEFYHWLEYIFQINEKSIIYDIDNNVVVLTDSNSDDNSSIYDSH